MRDITKCVSCQQEADCFLREIDTGVKYPFCNKCYNEKLYNDEVFDIIVDGVVNGERKVVERGSDGIARTFILKAKGEEEMDNFYDRFKYYSETYISRIYRYLIRHAKRYVKQRATLSDALSIMSGNIPPLCLEDNKIFFILEGDRYYIHGPWFVFWKNYITS